MPDMRQKHIFPLALLLSCCSQVYHISQTQYKLKIFDLLHHGEHML